MIRFRNLFSPPLCYPTWYHDEGRLMNDKDVFALLKQLADIPGPVGHEDPVQQALEKDWKKQGIKTSRD